jgi:hypothetical protein
MSEVSIPKREHHQQGAVTINTKSLDPDSEQSHGSYCGYAGHVKRILLEN